MAKQHFLMAAHTLKPKDKVQGWWFSEKMDGIQMFWDGGISRGLATKDVPYANTTKDARFLRDQIATGLWSRYAKAIHAPDWFLDMLPAMPLVGEAWAGWGKFQIVKSIISKQVPVDAEWKQIEYCVFDSPPLAAMIRHRVLDHPQIQLTIPPSAFSWAMQRANDQGVMTFLPVDTFEIVMQRLFDAGISSEVVTLLHQTTIRSRDHLDMLFDDVLKRGGEGGVLRNPDSRYVTQRSHHCLKLKPFSDAEGVVVGYTTGRETNRGSRLRGKMGALMVEFSGKRFKVSGFTDSERKLPPKAAVWAHRHPDAELAPAYSSLAFPRGTVVTFKYRELSDDGIPKEARYWRKR